MGLHYYEATVEARKGKGWSRSQYKIRVYAKNIEEAKKKILETAPFTIERLSDAIAEKDWAADAKRRGKDKVLARLGVSEDELRERLYMMK